MDSWILLYPIFIFFHHYYYLFWCSDGPCVASVSPFQLAPVSFYHIPIILGAWPYFLTQRDISGVISTFLTPSSILSVAQIRVPSDLNSNCRKVTAPPCISSHLWAWAFLPCLPFSSSANRSSRPLLFFPLGLPSSLSLFAGVSCMF